MSGFSDLRTRPAIAASANVATAFGSWAGLLCLRASIRRGTVLRAGRRSRRRRGRRRRPPGPKGRSPRRATRARIPRRGRGRPHRRGRATMSSTTTGSMLCASITGAGLVPRRRQFGLDDGDRACRLAHRHGIDEHDRVVAVEQLVGEVHPADAEVLDPYVVGTAALGGAAARLRRRSRRHPGRCCRSRPRAPGRSPERLDLVGVEVQVPPVGEHRLGGGIVVDGDRDVQLVVHVVEHAGDGGDHVAEEHVVRVGPARRAEAHRCRWRPRRRRRARCRSTGRRRRRRRAPTTAPAASSSASGSGRSSRMVPCSRPSTSGAMLSMRSTIAAARGSVARASAFSSSVRVRIRRARISSISVASQRSPSLSGAISGWS